jgi:hypothetical protein
LRNENHTAQKNPGASPDARPKNSRDRWIWWALGKKTKERRKSQIQNNPVKNEGHKQDPRQIAN